MVFIITEIEYELFSFIEYRFIYINETKRQSQLLKKLEMSPLEHSQFNYTRNQTTTYDDYNGATRSKVMLYINTHMKYLITTSNNTIIKNL